MTHAVTEILEAPGAITRERILSLEAAMEGAPQVECPLRHFFANGLYARELFIPAGTCAVGKIHRHEQMTMVLGDVTIVTPGEEPRRITSCEVFVSPAGIKRAVYAHSDTFFTTFHANPDNLDDVDALEAVLIAPSFAALEANAPELLEECAP